jgi:predicted permease
VTTVAVLSLALGMGANAAIFSIYERMLLRPLPVPEPERLVNLLSPGPKMGSQSSGNPGGVDAIWSYPMFRDLERSELPFTGLAAEVGFGANLAYRGDTVSARGALVSGGYFPTLGLRPALGRLFGPADDRHRDGHPLAVLDHAYWQTQLGADRRVIGQRLTVNGQPLTIVGVLPREFAGRTVGARPQVYVPLTHHARVVPGRDSFEQRLTYWLYVFGRLAPGVSPQRATAAVDARYRAILHDVELPLQEGASESYRQQFAAKHVVLEAGARGQSRIRDEAGVPLTMLFGVTGLVLLIAAANIANLLLVRAALRAGEMSVRLSLGARLHQLLGLLLSESFLLAAAGGVVGLFFAHGTLQLFRALLPAESDLDYLLALDPRTGVFLGALVLLLSLVGVVPALHGMRGDLAGVLRAEGRRASGSRGANRLRTGMATLQIALSLTLLVTAGLFVRSLSNVGQVDLGMNVDHLAAFGISPELNGLSPAQSHQLLARLESELGGLPGVTGVAASMVPLLAGDSWANNVSVEGFEAGPDTDTTVRFNAIGPGYFRTLGIAVLAGRDVELADTLGAPKVAVVNEQLVRKFGLGRQAVGKRMALGRTEDLDIEIIGVVADSRYSEVKDDVPPVYFVPWRQQETLGALNYYVRTAADPELLLPTLRSTVGRVAPNLPLEDLSTMQLRVRDSVFLDRMLMTVSLGFAVLSTLLAAIGLYGVIAFAVAQRTHEIGVRLALGAAPRQIRGLVLGHVARITGVGAVLGLLAGAAVGRLAGAILYRLEGHDPLTFATAAALLAAVALTAGMGPAWRASRVHPIIALRAD